jgi:muconolactone D-isomerase
LEAAVLFQVQITVQVPHDADMAKIKALSTDEIELAKGLQRAGKWLHIWRIAGKWANISIFNVETTDELHEILSSLPLFPYMEIAVTALCRHPASIEDVKPAP